MLKDLVRTQTMARKRSTSHVIAQKQKERAATKRKVKKGKAICAKCRTRVTECSREKHRARCTLVQKMVQQMLDEVKDFTEIKAQKLRKDLGMRLFQKAPDNKDHILAAQELDEEDLAQENTIEKVEKTADVVFAVGLCEKIAGIFNIYDESGSIASEVLDEDEVEYFCNVSEE